ncbi:MAG: DUF3667 domain-containing protein [Pseudomonadota bacterium]|nr:DUF3667 domain-containing protein [Pseudomonadota bacterium]
MTEGVEGVGEAVTGAMAARALEPHAGEAASGHHSTCLNCGTALRGHYCHSCGQQAHVHRSLGAFWHDIAHSVLHFEGKIWRTLPMLVWRPGELTRRYVEGERARFVSPMALFLFSVFAMFATFSAIGGPFALGMDPADFTNPQAQLVKAMETQQDRLKRLREQRAEEAEEGDAQDVVKLDREIAETEEAIRGLEQVTRVTGRPAQANPTIQTGWKRLDEGIKKFADNPALGFYKVQNNAYKFSWLLIPLSVPFMWLLFPFRRGIPLYDHTVFVTYSLSFMTLLMVTLSFARVLGTSDAIIGSAFSLAPPVHMYRQLKGAYGLRWWSAALRAIVLLMFAQIVLSIFIALLILLGAIG